MSIVEKYVKGTTQERDDLMEELENRGKEIYNLRQRLQEAEKNYQELLVELKVGNQLLILAENTKKAAEKIKENGEL